MDGEEELKQLRRDMANRQLEPGTAAVIARRNTWAMDGRRVPGVVPTADMTVTDLGLFLAGIPAPGRAPSQEAKKKQKEGFLI